MSIQYTIRAVPESVDQALRRLAKRDEKSLNAVTVEVLARGLELEASPVEHGDLDALIGCWVEDPGFDEVMAEFAEIDEDAWK